MGTVETLQGTLETQRIPRIYCAAFCQTCGDQVGWQLTETLVTYRPVICNECMVKITTSPESEEN